MIFWTIFNRVQSSTTLKMENKKDSTFIGVMSLLLMLIFPFTKTLAQPCINVFPHVEDFELAPVWTVVSVPNATCTTVDWAWGTPNHTYVIQSAGSGNKCWSTGGLTGAFYSFWEQGSIVSPCYDFTTLLYPHVKFKLFYDCEYHFDGGNLQYSLNGGATWVDVGTCGGTNAAPVPEPNDCNTQNWYNYPGINYLDNPPGYVPSKNGWCGNTQAGGVGWDPASPVTNCVGGNGSAQWITAQHCLTGCAGQPNVLLRFTFGAGYTCNNFDGLAIDSVAVSDGIPNSATFTYTCGGPGTLNFAATPDACPTNTYGWDFGDVASGGANTSAAQNPSHTFSGPGTYTVSLTASGGACNPPTTTTQTINVMTASVTSFSNAACGVLGSATVTVNSSVNPTTYTWTPSGGNAAIATGLSAGIYTCSVSDAASCPVTATVNITQAPSVSVTVTGSAASCAVAGSATATPNGGTGPYTYTWSPMGGNAAIASGLPGGNYTVTITDNSFCTATATVTVTNIGGITATMASTSVACNGGATGSATVTPSSGAAPYSYTWSPGGGNAATASGLTAGNYTVLISDLNNCTVTATANISQPTLLTANATSTSVTCNGGTNGTANVVAAGGTAGYTYTWSPSGGNATTANGLTQGNYTVAVTDANLCAITATVAINQPTILTATVSTTTASCGQANGTANVIAGGGTPGYTYTWSPSGGNTNNAINLAGGSYTVTVKDANACNVTAIGVVASTLPFTLTATSTPVTCFGGTDGSATAITNGSAGPFTYAWLPAGGNTAATGTILPMGIYTANVTDNSTGCINSTTVNVSQPATPVSVVANGQTICNGQTANITSNANGGNGTPFTFLWSTGANTANITVTPLVNTTYTVVAADSKGCTANDTALVNVLPPLTIVVTSNDTICPGKPASLSAVAGGGNGNYTITWQPGGLTGSVINVTPATTTIYTATVTDGCTVAPASATGQVVVTPIPILNFGANPASGCMPVCADFTGVATSVANNNVVSYNWVYGDGNTGTGINSSHCYLVSGNYHVTLYGLTQQGCKDSLTLYNLIHVFPVPTADFTGTPSLTTDIYNNTITFNNLSISATTPAYQWIFPNGVTTSVVNPIYTFEPEGTYPVTLIVTNSYGCADTITRDVIIQPDYTFYAPNAFTPNDDGLNERFRPTGTAWDLNTYKLWVFDRWGNQVFFSSDAFKGWNGTYRSEEVVQEDVYVWKVELKDVFGKSHEYNGHISVIK
jgi:gliding motility-associated-like protein